MLSGSCLCGDVTYTVTSDAQGPSACHCGQCRAQSGNVWASAYAPKSDVTISGPVAWFDSSPDAKRGFCPRCGSFLFWAAHAEDTISFSLGSLTSPHDIKIAKHIFVSEKGSYYDISDNLPKRG